jgi:hypothetical protein
MLALRGAIQCHLLLDWGRWQLVLLHPVQCWLLLLPPAGKRRGTSFSLSLSWLSLLLPTKFERILLLRQ